MTDRPVQVGVVGIGWWSDVLAGAVSGSPGIEVRAGYSRDRNKRDAFAAKFACEASASLDEMLAIPDLDGIVVTTPNNAHLEIVRAAAKAGKHVFVEKPIANSVADGEEIRNICAKAGVTLSVGHSYRRHSGIRHIRQLIETGELGRISLAEGVFSKDHGLKLTADGTWRSKSAEMPGGCLMQIGIHHIDNLIYLLGDVVEVSSMMARLETAAEISDITTVLMRFADGAIGFVAADYISSDRFVLTISGTKATARFDLKGGVDILPRGAQDWQRLDIPATDYLRAQLEEFADCIRTGAAPEVGGAEALAPLRVVHAAIRSNEQGRTVPLCEFDDALRQPTLARAS